MSRKRQLLFYGFLVAFVLAVTTIVVEVAARIIYNDNQFTVHNDASVFQHDEILGWKGIPGYEGVPRDEFKAHIAINSHGFRDSDWNEKVQSAKDTGKLKILFVGGSVLYGARLNKQYRVTEQLAELYQANTKNVEVFNAGIPGFGTDQEYRAAMTLIPDIEPDIVVLSFSDNDIGESALPYNPRHGNRVYKPFYNYTGDLVLNARVPKRFSYSIRNTFFERFRSKFFVDDVQKILDSYTYTKHDVPDNRVYHVRKPVQRRWFQFDDTFGFDSMFNLYQFRELYDRNSDRNIALLNKLQQLSEQKGMQFVVLLNMSTRVDATYSERDFMSRLEDNGIRTANINQKLSEYSSWSYVNLDGHPNFLNNYIRAVVLYNELQKVDMDLDPRQTSWYREIPSAVDFSEDDINRFIFGHWYPRENQDPDGFRWMGDSGYVMLRPPDGSDRAEVTITGQSSFVGENTSVYMMGGTHQNVLTFLDRGIPVAQNTVPDQGPFTIRFEHNVKGGLLLLNIVSSRSFRPYLSGTSDDERQLSVLMSRIAVTPLP